MRIEILGTGCPKCERLAENAQQAVSELGMDAEIVKVTDSDGVEYVMLFYQRVEKSNSLIFSESGEKGI